MVGQAQPAGENINIVETISLPSPPFKTSNPVLGFYIVGYYPDGLLHFYRYHGRRGLPYRYLVVGQAQPAGESINVVEIISLPHGPFKTSNPVLGR
jgi:hypothetical protein